MRVIVGDKFSIGTHNYIVLEVWFNANRASEVVLYNLTTNQFSRIKETTLIRIMSEKKVNWFFTDDLAQKMIKETKHLKNG